jgi:hypothetical protein
MCTILIAAFSTALMPVGAHDAYRTKHKKGLRIL